MDNSSRKKAIAEQYQSQSVDNIFGSTGSRLRVASLAQIDVEPAEVQVNQQHQFQREFSIRDSIRRPKRVMTESQLLEIHMLCSTNNLIAIPSPDTLIASDSPLASYETISSPEEKENFARNIKETISKCSTIIANSTIIGNNLGLVYMLMASFLFSFSSLIIKIIQTSSQPMPNFQIVFLRALVIACFTIAHQFIFNVPDKLGPPGLRGLLFARGTIGFVGMIFGYYALKVLSLGDATSLSFTSPVFTGIAGRLILKEPYELLDAVAAVCSLVGVMFIARPSFLFNNIPGSTVVSNPHTESMHGYGIIASLCGALTGAASFIIVRRMSKGAHPTHSVAYLAYCSIGLSIISYPISSQLYGAWIWPSRIGVYFWFIMLGACGYMAQTLFAQSLRHETAAKASTYNYIQVFFSFALELLIYGVVPNPWSIIGACIIGISVVGIFIAKVAKCKNIEQNQNTKPSVVKTSEMVESPKK